MPRKEGEGLQPEEQDVNLEAQELEDELEEDVGVPYANVTMPQYIQAERNFEDLVNSEEVRILSLHRRADPLC